MIRAKINRINSFLNLIFKKCQSYIIKVKLFYQKNVWVGYYENNGR